MKSLEILVAFLILINFISASCSEGQIDINTATEKELEKLYGIGPVKANAIIEARPFDSLDDLIGVNGIGEITLEKIKEQNLACVENEKEEKKKEDIKNSEKNKIEYSPTYEENITPEINLEMIPIKLNSEAKNIKSEDDERLNTKSYAIYGLAGFCILLAFLFAFKKIKNRKYKNEFGE